MNGFFRWAPYLALTLTVLFWGLSFIGTKIVLASFTPFSLIFIRFSIAACFFLGLLWYRGFPVLTLKEHGIIVLAALFQPGLYFLCETTGLQYTSASKASLIVATIPITVLGLSILFLKERSTLLVLAGMGVSLVGVGLLIFGDPRSRSALEGPLLGDALIFGAVLSMAFYTVVMKNMAQNHSTLDITGLQICYGALLFVPAFLWELPHLDLSRVNSTSLAALAGLTLFATIGAFFCFNYALARLTAARTSIFLNCVPIVTASAAWLILGERLTLLQLIGGMLVLVAVYLTNVPEKPFFTARLKKVFGVS